MVYGEKENHLPYASKHNSLSNNSLFLFLFCRLPFFHISFLQTIHLADAKIILLWLWGKYFPERKRLKSEVYRLSLSGLFTLKKTPFSEGAEMR